MQLKQSVDVVRPPPFFCYRIAASLAVMLWLACPASADVTPAAAKVFYTGPISAAQNSQLFTAVAGKPVERLVITSTGGEVEAGIALGMWVADHGLDIEVPEFCLSSCANYVFPAGHHKLIGPGAIVAWHGNYHHLKQTGLWRDDIAVRMQRHGEDAATAEAHVHAEVDRLTRLEHDFFDRIGVDEYLCWIGKMPPWHAPDYYFLSREDMARFGVAHVQTPPGYENTDVSGFSRDIRYIKLNDIPRLPSSTITE